MSDEIQANEEQQELTVEQLQEQLQAKDAQLMDISSQFEAVKAKADQLLDETKKAKAMKREAEAMAKKEAEEKARKSGDFEQLLKSSEEERARLSQQLAELQNNVTSEKIGNTSLKIASELADGANAEILSEFIRRRLQYTEDGIKVTDENGNLTIATLEDLKVEFKNNEKFKSLVRGNQSKGSGATGSSDGVAEVKVMSRGDFDKLDPKSKSDFFRKGGTLTDN